MDETKEDWDDLRLFLAVARGGGLAPAVAATGKSAPTLGRRMLALERRLGMELFRRLPRGYELTDEGTAFLARVTDVERQLTPLVDTAATRAAPVVKVSAGLWVTQLLCEHAAEILPDRSARLRFIAADEVVDIARREAVIGVRNQRPDDPGLAGRKVARVRFAVFARDGGVTTWARVTGTTPSALWVRRESEGTPAIEVTSARNALDLALAGVARCVLPTFVGQRIGGVTQVSPDIEELSHDQWLVSHHEDRFAPEVRQVLDRIGGVLARASAPVRPSRQ